MKLDSITHGEDILQDIRSILTKEPKTLILITQNVFEELKKSQNIRIDTKRVFSVSQTNEKPICLIKNSDDNKETDIILLNKNTPNLYSVIYFKSLYVNKHIPINLDNLETEKIILIE